MSKEEVPMSKMSFTLKDMLQFAKYCLVNNSKDPRKQIDYWVDSIGVEGHGTMVLDGDGEFKCEVKEK